MPLVPSIRMLLSDKWMWSNLHYIIFKVIIHYSHHPCTSNLQDECTFSSLSKARERGEKKTEQLTQLTTKVPFTAADSIKRQQASWLIDWSTTLWCWIGISQSQIHKRWPTVNGVMATLNGLQLSRRTSNNIIKFRPLHENLTAHSSITPTYIVQYNRFGVQVVVVVVVVVIIIWEPMWDGFLFPFKLGALH